MLKDIREYIGWWMLIPAALIMLLQVPGCINQQEQEDTKQINIMTQHCASQGKTYLQYPTSGNGQCI